MKEYKILPHQQFKKKVYSYCCLNHYISGKNTKGATFCYSHKPLGVINPISILNTAEQDRLLKTKTQKQPNGSNHIGKNLLINAQEYNLKNHTHYLNQIQGKHSLPKRLVYPREYIQKINKKNSLNKDQYVQPNYNHKTFQQIYDLFLKFAKTTGFSSQKQLKDDIIVFARQNNIKMQSIPTNQFNLAKTQVPHILFEKQKFLTYLQKAGLNRPDADKFWHISYNKDRFSLSQKVASNILMEQTQYVSMRAFIYNFKKFYLDECAEYKNMFSEPALRQRLIDLRLFLQPWYQRNIYLKVNMIQWKNQQLDICSFFKKSGFQEEFSQLVDLIGQRNRQWFALRTLSKCFYNLTDQKNIGLSQLNNKVADLIEQKTQSLICFMEFVSKFKQELIENQLQQELQPAQSQKNSRRGQQFAVTSLIQFLDKTKKQFQAHQQAWIVKWIKQIYKYLYFFKSQEYPQLFFDRQSLKLVCTGLVKINRIVLEQFVAFKNKEIDQFMELISSVSDQINQKVAGLMPQLQGNKKHLVQCNYVAETLLRICRRQNLYVFYQMHQVLNLVKKYGQEGQYHECINQLQSLIKIDPYKEKLVPDRFWKQYFIFSQNQQQSQQNSELRQSELLNKGPKYKQAYQNYKEIKKALKISQQPINIQEKKYKNQQQEKININVKKNSKAQKYVKKIQAQRQKSGQRLQQLDWNIRQDKGKVACSHSNGYCSLCNEVISTQVSSVVSQVQSLQNYLMNLLSI